MTYIENNTNEEGCVFCNVQSQPDGPENLIVFRGRRAFVILNRYPYNNGHIMIVTNRHIKDISQVNKDELGDLFDILKKSKQQGTTVPSQQILIVLQRCEHG